MSLRSPASGFACLAAAFLVTSAAAQPTTLTYIDPDPCCLAADGHGNVFAISTATYDSQRRGASVAKVDASGAILSTFRFEPAAFTNPLAAAVDARGRLWIVGTTGDLQQRSVIAELDASGTSLLFSGTFGGEDGKGVTIIRAIAFDAAGNAYIGGSTSQSDFPVTQGGFKGKFGGPQVTFGHTFSGPTQYGFIARLTVNGEAGYTIGYTALLGGEQLQLTPCPSNAVCYTIPPASSVSALAVDAAGIVTAAGLTNTEDFPVTTGAFQTQCQCDSVAVAFVTRLNAHASDLIWSTLLKPVSQITGAGLPMTVGGVALDSDGNSIIDGTTYSADFPVTQGVVQPGFVGPRYLSNGFVTKLDSTGSRLVFSTYYGATSVDHISAPRIDGRGNIWFSEQIGLQSGTPLQENSLMLGSSAASALIFALSPDGSAVVFSESLPNGAAGQDLLLDSDEGLIAAGPPRDLLRPIANGHLLHHPAARPSGISVLGVADIAYNSVNSAVAPGEMVAIYGTGLGPETGIEAERAAGETIGTSLGGSTVSFDGIAAPVLYASANQLNVLVPYGLAPGTQAKMRIARPEGSSQILSLRIVDAQPNLVTALNSDGSVNGANNPARQGSTITLIVNGAGALDRTLPDGTVEASSSAAPVLPVQIDFTAVVSGPHGPRPEVVRVVPSYVGTQPGTLVNLLRIDTPVPPLPSLGLSPFFVTVKVGGAIAPDFRVPVY